MAQLPKFIDVTRTFLPIDPNAFPESLHTSGREESPEDKIPVMAYKGYNFLPTPYGYKSYFGVNQAINIDAIDARVDAIFVYQNAAYENMLIALTDTGIWTKLGSAVGAWTNNVAIASDIDPNVHYEWTFVVVGEVLYAYMQGKAQYYTFTHSSTEVVVIAAVTPNFLNMAAQVGIFRAAGRLAFWDTDNSIGYSNIDDFADFTPSIETLAGNVKFSDVQGRIVTILPHGPGFIVYSTKSIIYIAEDLANTFQWNPTTILSSTGIAYPRNVTAGSPDTTHFAYTNAGLKRISKAQEETIVPEVTDYLKDSQFPIYLKVLQDRFLFLELMDPSYITGTVQRSDAVVPAVDYTFPGSSYTLDAYEIPDEPNAECYVWDGINNGTFTDMQPATPADAHPTSPNIRPVWTCYLSRNGVPDAGSIVWDATPVATVGPDGVEANMCPNGKTTTELTTDSTNKVAVTGAQAYVDGIWTMERFMQTQEAIWKAEDDAREAYLTAIVNRASIKTAVAYAAAAVTNPVTRNEATIGRYPSKFSGAQFGYSTCSFWLTRFCTEAMDLVRVKADNVVGVDGEITGATLLGYITRSISLANIGDGYYYPTLEALIAAMTTGDNWEWDNITNRIDTDNPTTIGTGANIGSVSVSTFTIKSIYGTGGGFITVIKEWQAPTGYIITNGTISAIKSSPVAGRYINTSTMNAYNKGIDVDIAPIPESAYCEITGWTYTKNDNTQGTIAVGACGAAAINPAGAPTRTTPLGSGNEPGISGKDGSYCGQPFEGAIVDAVTVTWPTEVVTIPGGTFFLRSGSPAPVYPTIEGALVYDLQLKKWGKMRQRYKHLLDYSPINSTSSGIVDFAAFGILGGILTSAGKIKLFDRYPTDSYISYGKIGYYRDGNTSPEEVRVDFRELCTGYVKVETSLDGHFLASELTKTEAFTSVSSVTLYGAYPGRWANIEIGGIFDINYLEYRGFKQGRR